MLWVPKTRPGLWPGYLSRAMIELYASLNAFRDRGLVAFDGQDPVGAAFGEVGDVIALAVQRVGGDHRPAPSRC
jgi:hypothetical protein